MRLGCLCELLRQYHLLRALQTSDDCSRSGRCDGHSLQTAFAEIPLQQASVRLAVCRRAFYVFPQTTPRRVFCFPPYLLTSS
jgi:hypothetical protein